MIGWVRDLLAHPNRIHYPGPGVPPRPTVDKPTLGAAIVRLLGK